MTGLTLTEKELQEALAYWLNTKVFLGGGTKVTHVHRITDEGTGRGVMLSLEQEK